MKTKLRKKCGLIPPLKKGLACKTAVSPRSWPQGHFARRGEMSLMRGTVSPTLPQSLHHDDVYQRGRKQAKTKKSLWTWIWLSGIFNNMKVRQHLTKWVSWNNCDENWNNSNSLFDATFSLPLLSSDLKVSIINKLNFYGKERFFTETINSSVWIGKIQKN